MIIARYGTDDITHNAHGVVTVGTFDGVHAGHRSIIEQMRAQSTTADTRIVVVTFDPHPQIVLQRPDREPVRLLSTIEERCDVLASLGVDLTVVIPFSRDFASTPAESFVRSIIVDTIGVEHFFIGHDHRFGKDRQGDEELLQRLAPECGFHVHWVEAQESVGMVVSSTKIRQALLEGDVQGANRMLGRSYELTGRVVEGDKRGTELGIPTANIKPLDPNKLMPGNGVYIVSARIDDEDVVGMANIGTRPTFSDGIESILEVHFLDLQKDLYGRPLSIRFHHRIRSEQRFESKEAFLEQLDKDRATTMNYQLSSIHRSES
jgi:riboflavin kinase / FMN adenylyltransferase